MTEGGGAMCGRRRDGYHREVNLILLHPEDFDVPGEARVRLTGRRAEHLRKIHRARVGDELCVGAVGGRVGRGRVCALDRESAVLEVWFDEAPPPPLDVTLLLALPRPPVLRRVLIAATSMGVKRIVLLNANRVEKSFWQSHALEPHALHEQLVLGLEQARDTVLPVIELRERFRAFVEDELPLELQGRSGFVAEPGAKPAAASRLDTPALVAIGPEGGWVPFELERLQAAMLQPLGLGDRILRVETALAVLLGRFV